MENHILIKPSLLRMKSQRFEKINEKFDKVTSIQIIFQNIICIFKKFRRSFLNFNIIENIDLDDKNINLENKNFSNLFGSLDEVSGDVIDLESLDDLTDKIFEKSCNNSSITSMKYARFFFYMDKLTKISESIVLVLFPISDYIIFPEIFYIILVPLIFILFVCRVMCDWSILMEKYANISDSFSKLAHKKEDERIDEYESLVNRYRSSWLYSDSIKLKLL